MMPPMFTPRTASTSVRVMGCLYATMASVSSAGFESLVETLTALNFRIQPNVLRPRCELVPAGHFGQHDARAAVVVLLLERLELRFDLFGRRLFKNAFEPVHGQGIAPRRRAVLQSLISVVDLPSSVPLKSKSD